MDIGNEVLQNTYEIATQEADTKVATMQAEMEAVREESRAIGILQKIHYDAVHNELLRYATLFQVRKNKEYKKGGMNWNQFCEAIGQPRRSVETRLRDLQPLFEEFTAASAALTSIPFNKIRYLGKSIAAESAGFDGNTLTIDNTSIPFTPENKDDIEAAIDTLIETHKRERKELKAELAKAKKHVDGVVAEETKGLTVERDALVKEVDRLKKFEPKERDGKWAKAQMSELAETMRKLAAQCQLLISDDQVEADRRLQAEVEAKITEAEGYLQDIRREWIDRFTDDF